LGFGIWDLGFIVKHTPALVVVFATVLYLGPLFLDAPLTDPDEGLHAVIAQEMHDRGDFLVPRFLGRAFLDKPILFFWTQLASIGAFGMSTAAARLPGMLFALLGIVTTGWLARVLFDRATGLAAATCYATMVLPFLLAQAPVHDMALVPFTNLALGFLWRARVNPKSQIPNSKSQRWVFGFGIWDLGFAGVALGLSVLTKGLEGVAIVGIGYGAYLLLTRGITWTVVWQGIAVLAIAVVIALPWYLAMEAREPGYLRYYFIDRHLLGFATDTQRHAGQPWWFYVPLAVGGGLPWTLYMNLKGIGLRGKGLGGGAEILLWTYLVGAVALLSLSGSKAVTYLLPAMPAIAILAARSWVLALSAESQDVATHPLRAGVFVHAALFFIIAALTPWVASRFGDQPVRAGEAVAFAVLSAVWLWLVSSLRRRPAAHAWPRLVVATGVTYVLAFALLGPPLAQAHSARDLAGYFSTPSRLPRTIYIMDVRVSFVYYLRPDVRRDLRENQIQSVSVEQLAAMQPFPSDAVVALPADLAGRLSRVPQLASASRQAAGRYVIVSR
jgi:4-amino-4-deoxy-L-arabinose transferase-like glycosyltransferase